MYFCAQVEIGVKKLKIIKSNKHINFVLRKLK